MNNLKISFLKAKEHGVNFVAVMVDMGMEKPEIIVNPIENVLDKLAYYEKAYDNDLRLKANPNIRIVGVTYGMSLMGIQWDLLGD